MTGVQTCALPISHDAAVAARADRVLVLVDGAVAEDLDLGRDDGQDRPARLERVRQVLTRHGV